MTPRTRYAWSVVVLVLLAGTGPTYAEDTVRYRDRTSQGERAVQEVRGRIESESLAGVRIGGKLIPADDIVDVDLEFPGAIRLDVKEARQAEDSRKTDDAIRRYRALAASPTAAGNKSLKRWLEARAAYLLAAKADAGPTELQSAVAGITKFIADYPDSWQRVPHTRTLARLYLDTNPPNFDAARRAYEELSAAAGATPEVKAGSMFAVVDLLFQQKRLDEARKVLSTLSASDPRAAAYQVACSVDPAQPGATIAALEAMLAKADPGTKPTIYNLIGDCCRLDPKREKDALFAYLWVDLIYNSDPYETSKAQDSVAQLFRKMSQDDRAKQYRDRARGR
ncbi:MAG: tetratricopeptide repeat protein [Gemmataceae bacterium]|nr:tetratricopeptide repeat protein [Gemmataceae bacterium]